MNVIVVLDQERVYNDLKKQFGNKVQVVHLPKSGGVSRNSSTYNLVHATATALIQVIFEVPNMNIYIEWFLPANDRNLKTVLMILFYSKETLSACSVTN